MPSLTGTHFVRLAQAEAPERRGVDDAVYRLKREQLAPRSEQKLLHVLPPDAEAASVGARHYLKGLGSPTQALVA